MAWNSIGTLTATQGSATLTGVGTDWIDQEPGWWVWIEGEDRPHEILTVVSATQITLTANVERATASGLGFLIIPTQGLNVVVREQLAALITSVQNAQAGWAAVVGDFTAGNYQLWLDEGNTGTVADFLADLKGDQGDPGPQGNPGTNGTDGVDGTDGDKGWSPVLSIISDGTRRVLQVSDWVGGEGTKPATGDYVGVSGLVALVADAIDIRGPQGASGAGTGDLLSTNNLSDLADPAVALTNIGGASAAQGSRADTAHGWGDHAGAGYVTDVSSLMPKAGGAFTGTVTVRGVTETRTAGTTAFTLSVTNGTRHTLTVSSVVALTDGLADGQSFHLRLINGDTHAPTYPAGTLFVGGAAPTLTGDDRLTFEKWGTDLICYAGTGIA